MYLEVESRQPKFYSYITKALDKGFLSHAYLVEGNNNALDLIKSYVNFFVTKVYEKSYDDSMSISLDKLIYLIQKNEFPDYVEIEPINNQIRKEQLLFIKEDFVNKSLYGTKKVYVVYFCEKMNSSAANAILKFLEEPADDIIAIFVTNNQYNTLDTIRSRCQILSLVYEKPNDEVFIPEVLTFVSDIEKRKKDNLLIKFNYYYNNYFKDKQQSDLFIKNVIKYYEMQINEKSNLNSLENNIMIISILEDFLKKLRYNVNIKLWIDGLLLSLMGV